MIRVLDSADSTLVEWGRQQHNYDVDDDVACDGNDDDSQSITPEEYSCIYFHPPSLIHVSSICNFPDVVSERPWYRLVSREHK